MSSPPGRDSDSPSPTSSNSASNPKPKPAPPGDPNVQKDHSEYYSNYKPGSSEIYRSWNARALPERTHLPKTDERCVFYCTQNVEDRYRARRPVCYTLCWRRAFPHESHQVAKAPQALTWSDYWSVVSRTRPPSTSEEGEVKEWAPLAGRYIYFSRGRYVATRHMFGMKGSGVPSPVNFVPGKGDDAPLPLDDKALAATGDDPLKKVGAKTAPPLQPETYEKIIALGPLPYEVAGYVRGGFDKLFGPTERLLSRGVKIWDDGVPIRVAKNLYELALAGEPLALAGKAVDLIIRSSRGNGGSGANP